MLGTWITLTAQHLERGIDDAAACKASAALRIRRIVDTSRAIRLSELTVGGILPSLFRKPFHLVYVPFRVHGRELIVRGRSAFTFQAAREHA